MRDYIDTDYLILVSSDGKKAGLEIFRDRIKKNKWLRRGVAPKKGSTKTCDVANVSSSVLLKPIFYVAFLLTISKTQGLP